MVQTNPWKGGTVHWESHAELTNVLFDLVNITAQGFNLWRSPNLPEHNRCRCWCQIRTTLISIAGAPIKVTLLAEVYLSAGSHNLRFGMGSGIQILY